MRARSFKILPFLFLWTIGQLSLSDQNWVKRSSGLKRGAKFLKQAKKNRTKNSVAVASRLGSWFFYQQHNLVRVFSLPFSLSHPFIFLNRQIVTLVKNGSTQKHDIVISDPIMTKSWFFSRIRSGVSASKNRNGGGFENLFCKSYLGIKKLFYSAAFFDDIISSRLVYFRFFQTWLRWLSQQRQQLATSFFNFFSKEIFTKLWSNDL